MFSSEVKLENILVCVSKLSKVIPFLAEAPFSLSLINRIKTEMRCFLARNEPKAGAGVIQ